MPRDSLFVIANTIEAGLWFAIAAGFALHVIRRGRRRNPYAILAAMAFLLFGISDLVELRTGAWWRPWWLLTWKSVCVATFILLLAAWRRRRRIGPAG